MKYLIPRLEPYKKTIKEIDNLIKKISFYEADNFRTLTNELKEMRNKIEQFTIDFYKDIIKDQVKSIEEGKEIELIL